MQLIFLGTSAALPTQSRWPTAMAVQREGEILLFDCGEGTQIQFQKAGLKPGKLSKIFISHLHGDHFYGLLGFLTSLQLLGRKEPIEIFGPKGLQAYLSFMQQLSEFRFRYKIDVHEVSPTAARQLWEFGEYQITSERLEHTIFSLGYRLAEKDKPGPFNENAAQTLKIPRGPLWGQLQKGQPLKLDDGRTIEPHEVLGPSRRGKKIAICLDTRPCANSIKLAHDVDILIHDGSFDNSKTDWAEETGHSTMAQAASVAKQAGAHQLILSHISQRYDEDDEAKLLNEAQAVFADSIIAHDLLVVKT